MNKHAMRWLAVTVLASAGCGDAIAPRALDGRAPRDAALDLAPHEAGADLAPDEGGVPPRPDGPTTPPDGSSVPADASPLDAADAHAAPPDQAIADAAPTMWLVPTQAQWTDHGAIFSEGADGAWDRYLWGGFGGTAVLKGGTFYLYYQGANGYDAAEDTVTYRAIGAATSSDGRSFQKHGGNPVLKWLPTNSLEEGAVSAAAALTPTGDVALYYGANTALSTSLVNGDGRLATAADGLQFTDQGLVLDHASATLWGAGDEVFPVAAMQGPGSWAVYYIPNGTPQKGRLGVAWGASKTTLSSSAPALAQGQAVVAWGMAGQAALGPDKVALFVSDVAQKTITAYHVAPAAPQTLSAAVVSYSFPNMSQGTVLLDAASATWYLFYRNADATAYGVRTAPAIAQ